MMGAEIYWKVRVAVGVEDFVEVKAVTETEAEELASKKPGVICVFTGMTKPAFATPDDYA